MDSTPPTGIPEKPEEKQPTAKCDQDGIDNLISALRAINETNRNEDNAQHHKDEKRENRHFWWHFGLTVVEIGLVAAYAYFTFGEWRTFDSERVTMESEFAASQRSSDAQLKEMREQRILDERAWVVPVRFETNGYERRVKIWYRNTGRTPALNVDTDIRSTSVINDAQTAKWPANPPGPYFGVFGPGVEKFSSPDRYQGGYFYGRIWYDDIFGNHHWTDFFVYSMPGNDSENFYVMPTGNDTDETEGKQPH